MAKRQSSIKGRGPEILFGGPQAVKVEPLASQPAVADTEVPDAESAGQNPVPDSPAETTTAPPPPPAQPPAVPAEADEPDLLAGLSAEARDAQAAPGSEEDQALADAPPPPTPEMEHAFFNEAIAAEEPPEPVAEAPSPTLEVTMEEQAKNEQVAMHEAPPPEISNVAGDVLPPRPSSQFLEMADLSPTAEGADIQSSNGHEKELVLPDRELTEEEQKKLLERLGSARIKGLDEEITKTYEQVLARVGENEDLTTECYNKLLQARDILYRRDAAKIPQAEYYIEQVRARLKRAAESESAVKKYAWWIAGWGLFWFLVFIVVWVSLNYSWFQDLIAPTASTGTIVDMTVFLPAMVWGGIGGVAAVFYSLFKHAGLRDFDSQFNLSYVGKPFLGVILGATVYMIIHLTIQTLGFLPAGLTSGGATVQAPVVSPVITYLLAWACGFKENRIFDLVDRVMKQIFSSGEEAPTGPATPAPPGQ
jgi:hypothetical protein